MSFAFNCDLFECFLIHLFFVCVKKMEMLLETARFNLETFCQYCNYSYKSFPDY